MLWGSDFGPPYRRLARVGELPGGEAGVVLCYNALHCGSARADRSLAADRTMGPGGTVDDLRSWLHDAGFTSIEVDGADAMATFAATRPATSG